MALVTVRQGESTSWANLNVIGLGILFDGITEISFSRKQNKVNGYGRGVEPIDRGYGNKEYEGSITLRHDTWKSIVSSSPNRDPLDLAPFTLSLVYVDRNTNFPTGDRDDLLYCEFTEDSMKAAQGDTKFDIQIPIIIGGIKR